jgi:myo-inositol-1(or 4)-monophosphatase
MKSPDLEPMLHSAVIAAQRAGEMMRTSLNDAKRITHEQPHDIKLELDVLCQNTIEDILSTAFPEISILGEEGVRGDQCAKMRWVVDPIDGTVNFSYGIPHACVSIALQTRNSDVESHGSDTARENYETIVGVVYDPFCNELWTALRGQRARLNGRTIRASSRSKLSESIVSVGFAKHTRTLEQMLPVFNRLIRRVRKVRIMGAAALGLVYVASGRFDAYLESGIRLWDIAAGGLILECAGGEFFRRQIEGDHTYSMIASNGRLRRHLQRQMRGK